MIAKFQDYLIRDFDTAENGNKAVGVNVTVFEAGTSVLAELRDEFGALITNPVVTDSRGYYTFWVEEGIYDLKTDVGTDREQFLFKHEIIANASSIANGFTAKVITGTTSNIVTLDDPVTFIDVLIDGRLLPPEDQYYTLSPDGLTVTINQLITTDTVIVIKVPLLTQFENQRTTINFANTQAITNYAGDDIVEGFRLETDSFYAGLSYGGAKYIVLSEANKDAAGYVSNGVNYTHFQIGTTGLWACLVYNTAIILDKVGCIKNDNTVNNRAAIDAAMSLSNVIYLTGDYYTNQVIFPIKIMTFRALASNRCKFIAIDDGVFDASYFAAPKTWVENSSSANPPVITKGVGFDGKTRDKTLVIHWYFGDHEDLFVDNGITNAIYMTAKNPNGSAITSTMVNNTFKNIWIEGTARIGFQVTEDAKTTDWEIQGGYIFNDDGGGNSVNISTATMAGAKIEGVHTYNADRGLSITKWSTGTRIANNYFENDVEINQGLNDTVPCLFGPNNSVLGTLNLDFGVVAGVVRSFNNLLTTVSHNYFGDKIFYSNDDSYRSSTPFSFSNVNPTNPAKFRIKNALIDGESRSGQLSPETTTDVSTLSDDFNDTPLTASTSLIETLSFGTTTVPADGEIRAIIKFNTVDLSQSDIFLCAMKQLPEGLVSSVYYDQSGPDSNNKWQIKIRNTTGANINITSQDAIVTKFNQG